MLALKALERKMRERKCTGFWGLQYVHYRKTKSDGCEASESEPARPSGKGEEGKLVVNGPF